MQSFEQKKRSLRRAIRRCLDRIGGRSARASAGAKLVKELGMPPDVVSQILDRTAADLRKFSASGGENFDAGPIIDRAIQELGELGFESRPFEAAVIERYLQQLPEADYQILRLFKQGKKHSEIAQLMGTDVDSVRRSLIKTYADLRALMIGTSNGGGGLPAPTAPRSDKPMQRMSVTHS